MNADGKPPGGLACGSFELSRGSVIEPFKIEPLTATLLPARVVRADEGAVRVLIDDHSAQPPASARTPPPPPRQPLTVSCRTFCTCVAEPHGCDDVPVQAGAVRGVSGQPRDDHRPTSRCRAERAHSGVRRGHGQTIAAPRQVRRRRLVQPLRGQAAVGGAGTRGANPNPNPNPSLFLLVNPNPQP